LSTEDSPDLADDLVGHAKVRVVGDARSDIIELSDYAYQRTLRRLAGLTDEQSLPIGARRCRVKRVGMGAATNPAADSNDDSNGDSQRPPRTRSSIASRSGVATELGDR
jgi:hypothetical protein